MPSVVLVTAYHDLDGADEMRGNARGVRGHLPALALDPEAPAYVDVCAGWPSDRPKPVVRIDDAARRLGEAFSD